jgi:hypothetical protein
MLNLLPFGQIQPWFLRGLDAFIAACDGTSIFLIADPT